MWLVQRWNISLFKFECPSLPQFQCTTQSAVNLLLCKYSLKLTATTERTICQNTVLMKMFRVWIALRTGAAGRRSKPLILCFNCKLSLTLRQQSPAVNGGDPVDKHSTVPLDSVNTRDASSERERQISLLPHARALNYVILASLGMSHALFSVASCRGWEIAIKHYDRPLSSPYAKTLSTSHRFFSDPACQ